jgi:hypothetical protein
MSDTEKAENPLAGASREEVMTALFANMVMQQTNMALMFLGKMPHPETGERLHDMEMAQLFIDQLEMLETKTKGNLDKREEGLLQQSLTAVRMAFVEAVQQKPEEADKAASGNEPATAAAGTAPEGKPEPSPEAASAEAEAESRKKFSKKY